MDNQKTVKNMKLAARKVREAIEILRIEQAAAVDAENWGTSEFLKYEINTLLDFMNSDNGECGFEVFVNKLTEGR